MATDVQVSARILRFPQSCSCCGDVPDTFIQTTLTRVTGKRIVRTQSKSWSFPICRRCVQHASLFCEADQCYQMGRNYKFTGIAFVIIGAILTCGLIGIPILIYGIFSLMKSVPRANHKAEELEREANWFLTKQCECRKIVVTYNGWNGSVHSFSIQSDRYAQAFIAANRGKVIG